MEDTKAIRLSIYGIIFLFEIASLVILFIGVPAAPIAFIWVIQKMVIKTVDKESLPHLTIVQVCLGMHPPFIFIVLWGLLPYYSIQRELRSVVRGVTFILFSLIMEGLTIYSIFTAYIVWDWSFNLYSLGYLNLSAYCRALVVFLGITWTLAWAAFLILVSCALEFRMPGIIKEMAFEIRLLLAICKVISLPKKESEYNSLE